MTITDEQKTIADYQHSLLVGPQISPKILSVIRPFGVKKNFTKNQVVYSTGDTLDHFFLVEEGRFSFSRIDQNGSLSIYGYVNPGSTFALPSVLLSRPATFFFESVEDSVATCISGETIWSQIDDNQEVRRELVRELSLSLLKCTDAVHDERTLSLGRRVAKCLIRNTDEKGSVKLSQDELAKNLGVSRYALGTHLQKLKELSLIEIEYGHVKLTDIDGLYTFSANP